MFVPPTLWPFNIQDVLTDCLSALEKGKCLNTRQRLLIDLLPEPPDETVCAAVAAHEHHVQKGDYENLVKTQAKYAQNELAIKTNPELRRQWERIKAAFNVQSYCDHKGVIRRTMGAERNLRPSFSVNMRRREDIFRAAFDAFCLRWNLYGMQNDEPLLLKLAVNITPYGTMIHIPAYWSFDPKRDIRWDAIARLHRARVPGRQGSALAEGLAGTDEGRGKTSPSRQRGPPPRFKGWKKTRVPMHRSWLGPAHKSEAHEQTPGGIQILAPLRSWRLCGGGVSLKALTFLTQGRQEAKAQKTETRIGDIQFL